MARGICKTRVDGNLNSRWTSGKSMAPGMWVQVELPESTKVAGLILDAAGSRNDYPRGYQIEVSEDGKAWGEPVAKGKGTQARTEIEINPQPVRFIKITQTGQHRLFWSIHDLEILREAKGTP